jgi:hypothetical protein
LQYWTMKQTFALLKTDVICDIDQVLAILRSVPGVTSADLLEGKPRVVIISESPISAEVFNTALSAMSCRLEDQQIQPE